MSKALVLAEIKESKIKKSSLEVVHALASQGCEVDVIVCGAALGSAEEIAKEVGGQGAKKLFTLTDESMKYYQAEALAALVSETFKSGGYEILGGAASALVKD